MNIVVESLKEGNPLTNDLPLVIDDFLMDLAQMHGEFDYSDIMNHEFSQEEIRKLRYLYKKYVEIVEEIGDGDYPEIKEIVDKVASIVKPQSSLTEATSMETAHRLQTILAGLHTIISDLDSEVKKSANKEKSLNKSYVQSRIKEVRDSARSMTAIVNSYKVRGGK